jgi:glutamine amidotransferase
MCQLLGMNANTPTDVMFSCAGLARRADEHRVFVGGEPAG